MVKDKKLKSKSKRVSRNFFAKNFITKFDEYNDNFFSSSPSLREYTQITRTLTTEEMNEICFYLENPTQSGIWQLKIQWLPQEGITRDIVDQYKKQFSDNFSLEELKNITKRITFIYCFFVYLYYSKKNSEEFAKYLEREDEKQVRILKLLNLKELEAKYKEAYEFFIENIFMEGFIPEQVDGIKLTKKGFYVLPGSLWPSKGRNWIYDGNSRLFPEDKGVEAKFYSTNFEVLENLQIFFEKINKISNTHELTRIFSPEEEVFSPYLEFFKATNGLLIKNKSFTRRFENGIREYEDKNYPHCINIVGLLTEDILVEIYESLYREVCPKNLGLGQVADLINNTLNLIFGKDKAKEPNINLLYDKEKKLLQTIKKSKDKYSELIALVRDITLFLSEESKYTHNLIKDSFKKNDELYLFPKYLQEMLDELIKYRNSTSHRSRVPIGDYEALRTLYICFYLYQWWNNLKKIINWKEHKEDILSYVLSRNK